MERIAVIAKLKPNAEKRATELIETGPPFDPDQLGFDRHSVYLSGNQAVFVFEGGRLDHLLHGSSGIRTTCGRSERGSRSSTGSRPSRGRPTPGSATRTTAGGANSVYSSQDRHRVLIAGGGVAALEAMVALRTLAEDRVDIELLSPDQDFFYRPLAVAEPFGRGGALRFDLRALATGCGARHRLRLARIGGRRPSTRQGRAKGESLPYDSLLLAIGARRQIALARRLDLPRQRRHAGLLADSR